MAVRNFYLKARIDGRKTLLTGGPARKDGGFVLEITQRDQGVIVAPCVVTGSLNSRGELCLLIKYNGKTVLEHWTLR